MTIVQALTFMSFLKMMAWDVVIGLAIGGLIAAPLSAHICRRLPPKTLMKLVGLLIILLGIRNIYTALA